MMLQISQVDRKSRDGMNWLLSKSLHDKLVISDIPDSLCGRWQQQQQHQLRAHIAWLFLPLPLAPQVYVCRQQGQLVHAGTLWR